VVGPEDLLNSGEIVEALGQAWTLSHITPALRGAFSAWLKGRARQELSEQRRQGILGPDDYREQSAVLNAECASGAYTWGSPLLPAGMGSAVRAALDEMDGKVRLIQLLLKDTHGDVPAEQVYALMQDNPDQVAEACRTCLDPNRQTPAQTKSPGTQRIDQRDNAAKDSPTATATPS
jgi:hypothetical protein